MGYINNLIGAPLNSNAASQISARSAKQVDIGSAIATRFLPGPADRSKDTLKYYANSNAWVRITSMVDIKDNSILSIKDRGSEFAKKWILQGGVLNSDGTQKSGLAAYKVGLDNPLGEFGYRPMPGIESITVTPTTSRGAVRMADVKLRVFTLEQLDAIDILYFRLGYSCLIEWGFSVYLDNSGNVQEFKKSDLIDPFKKGITKEEITKEISAKRKTHFGNYDAMLGTISNYTWTSTSDGGYECTLKVLGIGSVIDSLRINNIYGSTKGTGSLSEAFSTLRRSFAPGFSPEDLLLRPVTSRDSYFLQTRELVRPPSLAEIAENPVVSKLLVADAGSKYELTAGSSALDSFLRIFQLSGKDVRGNRTEVVRDTGRDRGQERWVIWEYDMMPLMKAGIGAWPGLSSNHLPANGVDFGFNRSILLGDTLPEEFKVDYKSLSKVLIINLLQKEPQVEGQKDTTSTESNQAYIKLGLLLSFLMNTGLLYEGESLVGGSKKKPVVYIDYNPATNYCYTQPSQLSIDPTICIIPVSDSENNLIPLYQINGVDYSTVVEKGRQEIPNIDNKVVTLTDSQIGEHCRYRKPVGNITGGNVGNLMEIFINVNYLRTLLETYERKVGSNGAVLLSEYLNEVLAAVQESLGGINQFRLGYDDDTNCIVIYDDQAIGNQAATQLAQAKLPVTGLSSVVLNYSLQTEVSTKVTSATMLSAIAASYRDTAASNDLGGLASLNTGLEDRVMPVRTQNPSPVEETQRESAADAISRIQSLEENALAFYTYLKYLYSPAKGTGRITMTSEYYQAARSYYLESLVKTKAAQEVPPSVLMPLTINITMPGISNIPLYEAFIIPGDRLPAQYRNKDNTPRIAFVVVGLTHTIQGNTWQTTIRGLMQYIDINKIKLPKTTARSANIPRASAPLPEAAPIGTQYPPLESRWYELRDFLRSDTANRNKFTEQYLPAFTVVENINKLCKFVLDPLCDSLGKKVPISSGYRCPRLNSKIGGARNSDHLYGRAADLQLVLGNGGNKLIYDKILELKLPFKQLINEYNYSWVHVAYQEGSNRGDAFKIG
jgi:zinc D-Ala-D-Ala carboxypeptidase